jgi:DNA topoisomerase
MYKGSRLITIVVEKVQVGRNYCEMELSDIAQGKFSKKEFLDAIENEI